WGGEFETGVVAVDAPAFRGAGTEHHATAAGCAHCQNPPEPVHPRKIANHRRECTAGQSWTWLHSITSSARASDHSQTKALAVVPGIRLQASALGPAAMEMTMITGVHGRQTLTGL